MAKKKIFHARDLLVKAEISNWLFHPMQGEKSHFLRNLTLRERRKMGHYLDLVKITDLKDDVPSPLQNQKRNQCTENSTRDLMSITAR